LASNQQFYGGGTMQIPNPMNAILQLRAAGLWV
jgi:hypothetical protein